MARSGPKPSDHCKNGHAWTPENTYIVNRKNRTGSFRRCKTCFLAKQEANREQRSRYSRRYQREQNGVFISDKDVSNMLVAQDGLCAICYERPAVVVDHDHDTGRIRGMLCRGCNLGIGLLGDNEESLRWALEYISAPRLEGVI